MPGGAILDEDKAVLFWNVVPKPFIDNASDVAVILRGGLRATDRRLYLKAIFLTPSAHSWNTLLLFQIQQSWLH